VFYDDDSVVDEKERDGGWRWERCGGYEQIWEIWVTPCQIQSGSARIGEITRRIRTCTCGIGEGKMTCTRNSHMSLFVRMISPISSHHSHSHPQVYHHLKTQSWVIALYLCMPWSRVNTEYSIHWVQPVRSSAYTEDSIHRSTAYTEFCIHRVLRHPMIGCLLLPASLSSLPRPCCS